MNQDKNIYFLKKLDNLHEKVVSPSAALHRGRGPHGLETRELTRHLVQHGAYREAESLQCVFRHHLIALLVVLRAESLANQDPSPGLDRQYSKKRMMELTCWRNFSDSLIIRSMSCLDKRPVSLVMVILFSFPDDFSTAVTLRMPLVSTSKVTWIWGTPRPIAGMWDSSNLPRRLLSLVRGRSPSYTWMSTFGWLSAYVLKTCVWCVGMVVPLLMTGNMTPPAVSMPMDSGVTSSSSRSCTTSLLSPCRMAHCTAAPYATASSGLMDWLSSLPPKKSLSMRCIRGILVDPPTSTTSWTFLLSAGRYRRRLHGLQGGLEEVRIELLEARPRHGGVEVDALKQRVDLRSAPGAWRSGGLGSGLGTGQSACGAEPRPTRTTLVEQCGLRLRGSAPLLPARPSRDPLVLTSMVACVEDERVRLARSHAVRRRRKARLLLEMSLRYFLRNSLAKCSTIRESKSSPPRCVCPAVAFTSKMPPAMAVGSAQSVRTVASHTAPIRKHGNWRQEYRSRLCIPKMVFLGFMALWFMAESPMSRSVSVKATLRGVQKFQSCFPLVLAAFSSWCSGMGPQATDARPIPLVTGSPVGSVGKAVLSRDPASPAALPGRAEKRASAEPRMRPKTTVCQRAPAPSSVRRSLVVGATSATVARHCGTHPPRERLLSKHPCGSEVRSSLLWQ
ncbi:Chorismate synthase [Frankliniella fusca]|uniref:Chorismate synthase n=1 Tax=Frankliniella fusca TaxID=407009 RepID=A0AAE1HHL8_9NEOP|nr:Chorismate synthase [Frankliniella fusca]